MTTTIEAPFTISDMDRKVMESKISDLQKYEERITQVNIFFKKDDGNIPEAILAEIRIRVPGADLFAENKDGVAIKAFSQAFNAVKRQVKKRRSQMNDHRSDLKEINMPIKS